MAAKDSKESSALPEGQAERPKKKSKVKRLVIILAILLLTLGGVGAYWWLYLRTPATGNMPPPAKAETSAQTAPAAQAPLADGAPASSTRIERQSDLPRSSGLVLPLPMITVNLADPGGRRYLKLGMEVEANADISTEIKVQEARIRDAVIMLLAGKSYGDIATPDGKVMLKAEVAARLNQILGAQRVIRIYFTDFVVE
ncbi:MAG: flagellar basal body-associated FliL family protein [Desulfovibrio sp.]|nr:flagellar basal body-associated FliL family protein [Desulfovibrio sp.]